jgi:uncharacterized SAM-binding protein YcdF (DUF218 family)
LQRAGVGLAAGAAAGFFGRDLGLPGLVSYWGDSTPLVVTCAAATALLCVTRLRSLVLAAAGALGVAWLVVGFTGLSAWITQDIPRRDPPREADAVFVFSSGLQDDGEPTTPAMSRLLRSLELMGEGYTHRLVLSELRPPTRSYTAVALLLMHHLGLQGEVLTVGPVANTRDEAVLVGALSREKGFHRLLVVTSPLHSRRASAALENEGVEVVSVPSVETDYDLETLRRMDHRLKAFASVMHERVGLLVYGRRGWLRTP